MSTPGGWAAPGQEPPEDPTPSPTGQEPPQAAPPPVPTQPIPAPPPYAGPPQAAGPSYPPHAAAPQPPPAATYQPGVIPFRPISLGDIYGAAFKIVRGNPASTVGIALLLSLAVLIPTTPIGLWVARQGATGLFDPVATDDDLSGFGADFLLTTGGQMIPTIAGSLATIALAGFIAYVTGQAVLGRKVKLPETWRGTRAHLLRVIGVSLLISVILLAMTAVFLAPGIAMLVVGLGRDGDGLAVAGIFVLLGMILLLIVAYLFVWTRVAFAGPAIVLEGMGIGASLRRSWQLTRFTGFWRILGIRVLTMLLVTVLAQIIVTPLSMLMVGVILAGGLGPEQIITVQVLVASVTTLITTAATTPITATVDTLLYVDQRMRDEALDVQLIQAVEGHAPLPWQPALDPLHSTGA